MNIFRVTLWLLLIVGFWQNVALWNMTFLMGYIIPLTTMLQTQEVNWFISEILNDKDSENLQLFFNTVHTKTKITQMVMTNNTEARIMKTQSKRNYLGIVLTTGPDDPINSLHATVLTGRHSYLNFIIYVRQVKDDFQPAKELLIKMNERNFQNAFLYVGYVNGSSDLFGVTIFPEFKIELRTNFFEYLKQSFSKYASGALDCMGAKFYTPLRMDVPAVFEYTNRLGHNVKQGISYRILYSFMEYINASLVAYEMPKDKLGGEVIDMKDALELIRSHKVLVLAHSYALFPIDDDIDKSYPIMVVRWCLMVPIWNTVSAFYYPVKPFDILVWYAVLLTFLCLAITDCLWILRDNLRVDHKRTPQLIWYLRDSVLHNFCYIINAAAGKNIQNPSRLRLVFYVTVFFHGFFLSANYSSLLGSILTVTLFREQINTLEDLIRANVSTLILDYEYEFLLSGGLNLTNDFLKLIRPVDAATFHHYQLAMNQSFAYFITDDKWHFLELQQKHLKQGFFKLTDICFGSYHLAFPMEQDSVIWRNLEYFLFRIHSSGMLGYYESLAFDQAIQAGLVKRYTSASEYTSAGMDHVMMIFCMLAIVAIVASVVFLGECLYFKLNLILRKINRNKL